MIIHIFLCRCYDGDDPQVSNWDRLLTSISTDDPVSLACTLDDMKSIVGDAREEGSLQWHPLHFTAFMGTADMIDVLMIAKADVNQVSAQEGRNALHYAVVGRNIAVIAKLLEYNADPSVQDNQQKTPLHIAAERGYGDAVQTLIKYALPKLNIQAKDANGNTAKQLAEIYSHLDCVTFLDTAGSIQTVVPE